MKRQVGPFFIEIEDDLIISRSTPEEGSLELFKTMWDEVDQILATRSDWYLLTDLSPGLPISARARKYYLERSMAHVHRMRAIAHVGARAETALTTKLMLRGMALLGYSTTQAFFATEAEARVWLNEQRVKAKVGSPA